MIIRFSGCLCALALCLLLSAQAFALEGASTLAAHKAVYSIALAATHSGSQVTNISGQMTYEWKPGCDGWITDHHFTLIYEYADSPSIKINSDFSTYESFDGKSFDYAARRKRNGQVYSDIRGHAALGADSAGKAIYSLPANLSFDLGRGMLFPTPHTLQLAQHANQGAKFFDAQIFDGSDEDGPIEINSFIGGPADIAKAVDKSAKIDMSLLGGKAWNVRMAVFPLNSDEAQSDYEMTMIFHENGIISDMLIDYNDFSVKQKLVSLTRVPAQACESPEATTTKP